MATESTVPDSGLDAGGAGEELSLRDELDAAFTQHASEEPGVEQRPRDDLGRFAKTAPAAAGQEAPGKAPAAPLEARAPAAGTQPPGKPAGMPGAPSAAPQPADPKAPASWTPTAREKWAGLDPEVRAEVLRREAEGQRVLQESAGLRNFAQQFFSVVSPYEMFIRAENSDPLSAVQNLMNTAATLRMGTPHDKVQIVANICRQHGIDLQMLDNTLAQLYGVTPDGQQQQPAQLRDPRVDQLLAYQQQQQRAAQQAAQQREQWEDNQIRQSLQQFAATHEFYNDVKDTMADLVDRATARGEPVDMEKIYARACQLDDQISTILAQRNHAGAGRPGGTITSPAVLRARRAASSIKGDPNPAGSTVPSNDTLRSSIEAAFDAHTT